MELLEQNYVCHSEKLYSHGHIVGTTSLDAINRKQIPNYSKSNSPQRTINTFPILQNKIHPPTVQSADSNHPESSATINTMNNVKDSEDSLKISSEETKELSPVAEPPAAAPVAHENTDLFSRDTVEALVSSIPESTLDNAIEREIIKDITNHQIDHNLRGGSTNGYHGYPSSNTPYQGEYHSNYPPHIPHQQLQQQQQQLQQQPYPSYPYQTISSDSVHRNHPSSYYPPNPNPNPNPSSTPHSRPYNTLSTSPLIQQPKMFMRSKTWMEKVSMVQSNSAFGHLPGWVLKSFIVKSGDDLRKEMLAMQLIELFQTIFKSEGLDIFLRPYQIICTGHSSGLIEYVESANSIDSIKKSSPDSPTLKDYFQYGLGFGASYSPTFTKGLYNFVRSLVGYSLVTYLLQVKDRHNANIMIEGDGTMVHIDFGFIFGDSPGFNINFENAPFKLTQEYIDLMGGVDSSTFKMFENLFVRGFLALQKHIDEISAVVDLFYGSKRKNAVEALRSRLGFARTHQDIMSLVRESLDNWRTKQYDWFQQKSNNILM